MATTAPVKICRVCKKDVSQAKRVKDPAGNYYCDVCHKAAASAKAGDSAIPLSANEGSRAGASPPDEVDLLPPTTVVRPAAKPLPAFCPNCDAPVLGNRKMCIKCHRDVTQMDAIIKRKAEAAAKGTSTEEVAATWIARVVKVVLAIVIVGIVVFVGWGIYLQIFPPGPFDEFPKSREALIKQWLGYIADGTDKSYGKAYLLTSFRERIAGNDRSENQYKLLYTKIHDAFAQKYGANWIDKVKITNPRPADTSESTELDVVIDGDEHPAEVQVQISLQDGVVNMTIRRDKPQYPENGKWHYGMIGLSEFPIHPTPLTGMEEQFGHGKPDLPVAPIPEGGQ